MRVKWCLQPTLGNVDQSITMHQLTAENTKYAFDPVPVEGLGTRSHPDTYLPLSGDAIAPLSVCSFLQKEK